MLRKIIFSLIVLLLINVLSVLRQNRYASAQLSPEEQYKESERQALSAKPKSIIKRQGISLARYEDVKKKLKQIEKERTTKKDIEDLLGLSYAKLDSGYDYPLKTKPEINEEEKAACPVCVSLMNERNNELCRTCVDSYRDEINQIRNSYFERLFGRFMLPEEEIIIYEYVVLIDDRPPLHGMFYEGRGEDFSVIIVIDKKTGKVKVYKTQAVEWVS